MSAETTTVQLDRDAVTALHARLDAARLPQLAADGWDLGVPGPWLRTLLADWRAYDTAALQRRLDALEHVRVDLDGQRVHAVVADGRGPDPLPLVLTHGWPGTFLEHLALVPLLTDPAAHGGDAADAFTVVLPSLPGYGFSDPPPPGGQTGRDIAGLWHRLMDRLGHRRYAAHGSDLGVMVTSWLGRDRPGAVVGTHVATPHWPPAPEPWSAAERDHAEASGAWTAAEGGYAHEHATKPATLGAALLDSPAGLAAWVGEKVSAWSAVRPDGTPAFPRELLLATLTLYWATGTIATSLLPYAVHRRHPESALPADDLPQAPGAVTNFGGERVPFPKPPRDLAARYVRLTSWAEHGVGGHFPAVAEPELLAERLREVFRPLR